VIPRTSKREKIFLMAKVQNLRQVILVIIVIQVMLKKLLVEDLLENKHLKSLLYSYS
jgi:hypothetical protein